MEFHMMGYRTFDDEPSRTHEVGVKTLYSEDSSAMQRRISQTKKPILPTGTRDAAPARREKRS